MTGVAAICAVVGVGGPVDDELTIGVVIATGCATLAKPVVGVACGHGTRVVGGGDQAAQMVFVPVFDFDEGDAA
ncbi:hypothetical protein QN372_15735 [Undibacterium sp. RTI2.1]|uniref:hypothetical protein n=1 Tax=unclassified Undibacterium TaxID=2630295 RepID=UPI002B23124C|nr:MULTISPECIES: hypothetical protein [unclassified Undibacterium]MEB0032209.1 hypothetical protein [Undibacterium sp. RTI2.1]